MFTVSAAAIGHIRSLIEAGNIELSADVGPERDADAPVLAQDGDSQLRVIREGKVVAADIRKAADQKDDPLLAAAGRVLVEALERADPAGHMQPIQLEENVTALKRDRPFFARALGTAFDMHNDASTGDVIINLYDEIGFFGVSAQAFRQQLDQANGANLVLRINSPGGDVFDGIAMYNDLVSYPGNVRVEITGLAASAASLIAMAGRKIAIGENAFMMIHNAWGVVMGDRHRMTDAATLLGKIDGVLARTYARRTGIGIRQVQQMLDDETWLTGQEAKDQKFADEIIAQRKESAQAKFDLSVFNKVPDILRGDANQSIEPEIKTLRDLERVFTSLGGTRNKGRALMNSARSLLMPPTRDAGTGQPSGVNYDAIAAQMREIANRISKR